jgi:hypothetical protein
MNKNPECLNDVLCEKSLLNKCNRCNTTQGIIENAVDKGTYFECKHCGRKLTGSSTYKGEEKNQCDGCARGLPLKDGIHKGEGYDMIGCTKNKYIPTPHTEKEDRTGIVAFAEKQKQIFLDAEKEDEYEHTPGLRNLAEKAEKEEKCRRCGLRPISYEGLCVDCGEHLMSDEKPLVSPSDKTWTEEIHNKWIHLVEEEFGVDASLNVRKYDIEEFWMELLTSATIKARRDTIQRFREMVLKMPVITEEVYVDEVTFLIDRNDILANLEEPNK